MVTAHGVDSDCDVHAAALIASDWPEATLFALGANDFLAAIKAVGANVVTQVHFTRGGFGGQCGSGQKIMSAVHAPFGGGLFVLLDCHGAAPSIWI